MIISNIQKALVTTALLTSSIGIYAETKSPQTLILSHLKDGLELDAKLTRAEKARKICEDIAMDDVTFVQCEFTNVFGEQRSYTITSHILENSLVNGICFDGSSVEGYSTLSESDLMLIPDLDTLKPLPWTEGHRRMMQITCDVHTTDGGPFETCPRSILKRELQRAESLGYTFNIAPELEFFLFERENQTKFDHTPYCGLGTLDASTNCKLDILTILNSMGVRPEKTHHEVAPNQHEFTMRYASALTIADNLITMKTVTNLVSKAYGYTADFRAKPLDGQNGNGMHLNFSLSDRETSENLFYDASGPHNLSQTARHFIAGVLKHIKDLSAILNPTENSYKRLVKGYEAPVYVCWGAKNRSALIRIPNIAKGDDKSCRAELRSPDPQANPYLGFAAILRAGLDGIEQKLELEAETTDNLFLLELEDVLARGIDTLPGSLDESLSILEKSTFAKSLMGEKLHSYYINAKRGLTSH